VEKKFKIRRKRGKWLADPTRKEKELNSPLDFMSAAEKASERS